MTITEVQLLEPLRPLPNTATRTIRAGEGVTITATNTAVDVVTGGRRYSYPRGLCVLVSDAGRAEEIRAETRAIQAGLTAKRVAPGSDAHRSLAAARITPEQELRAALKEHELAKRVSDEAKLRKVLDSGPFGTAPKPEEPLPTKRKRRSKRVAK